MTPAHRLSLPALILAVWRLKLARALLWAARVTNQPPPRMQAIADLAEWLLPEDLRRRH